ncbi:MAG TPA: NAD+ synthase [Acidimicrobiales bacterium]|nr:NAD+ synthase [Acidimicrobiales bacterium]
MVDSLRVALCQVNLTVGDLEANVERMTAALKEAEAAEAHVACFPELGAAGYPPEDLVLKRGFVAANEAAVRRLAAEVGDTVAVVGFVEAKDDAIYNSAAICHQGAIVGTYQKHLLPNYAVFDEQRYFARGTELPLWEINGLPVGVSICEDAWQFGGPIPGLGAGGARVILNLNGSPFYATKGRVRERLIGGLARETDCPIAYVNLLGGQDELVFDGDSFVCDAAGTVVARAEAFVEQVLVVDVVPGPERPVTLPLTPVTGPSKPSSPAPEVPAVRDLSHEAEVWEAVVLGTRDYVQKNGFEGVVLGLSGGVDSSLVAAIAVDAVGADKVHGVLMPSRYSSEHSVTDADRLAEALGIETRTIPIEDAHAAMLGMLAESFEGREPDLTEENLQSRIRGMVLMSLSNKFGWLVLTTSNKSESAVGYATLFGDTAGGFAVIKDVNKLLVYELARYRNRVEGRELIPEDVLTKPPSAELRPDQRDDQSLPPYEELDPILELYVEEDRSIQEIVAAGHEREVVEKIVRLVDLAEYKRRLTPPGPKLTTKSFGRDRRLPITNRYRG